MMIWRATIILLFGAALTGCAGHAPRSVAGGECKVFDRPPYEVRGQKPYDQDWIDSSIEGGVGGCGWDRPAPRPPELDAAPNRKAAVAVPVTAKKKPGLIRRIKSRAEATFARRRAPVSMLSVPAEKFVAPSAPPSAPIAAAPPPESDPPRAAAPQPPPRRSAIDELLHPNK